MRNLLSEDEYFTIKALGRSAGIEIRAKLGESDLTKNGANEKLAVIANQLAITAVASSKIENKVEAASVFKTNFMIPDDEAFLDIKRSLRALGPDRYSIANAYFMSDGIILMKRIEISNYKEYIKKAIEETPVVDQVRRISSLNELENLEPTLGELFQGQSKGR